MEELFKINGREYEWGDISIVAGGMSIAGFRVINYKKAKEKEAFYAKGRKALSIQSGNEAVTGNITFTQSLFNALNAVTGNDILSAQIDIIVSYGAEAQSTKPVKITTKVITGVEFTEWEEGMSQGDKFAEIPMPFLALDIKTIS